MVHRIGAGHLKQASALLDSPAKAGLWPVSDEYEIEDGEIFTTRNPYRWTTEPIGAWRFYDPLNDVPDLFLKFAGLHAEADFESAARRFALEYGLPDDSTENFASDHHENVGIWRAPSRLSLSRFRTEVRRASSVLSMYQAACNRDAQAVRSTLFEHRDLEGFRGWRDYFSHEPKIPEEDTRSAVAAGFRISVEEAQRIVNKTCRQRARFHFYGHSVPKPSDVGAGWHYHSLVGAMYLQMYWLMTSGGQLARCESPACDRIISLARPHTGGRKPPKHKRFCNDACREANRRYRKKQA